MEQAFAIDNNLAILGQVRVRSASQKLMQGMPHVASDNPIVRILPVKYQCTRVSLCRTGLCQQVQSRCKMPIF
jgi:hypothetical protein